MKCGGGKDLKQKLDFENKREGDYSGTKFTFLFPPTGILGILSSQMYNFTLLQIQKKKVTPKLNFSFDLSSVIYCCM